MAVKTSATAALKYKATSGGSFVTIGKVRDIKLDINRDALETTGIGDTDRTYAYGVRGTSGSGTLLYDPSSTVTDNAMQDIMNRILSDTESTNSLQLILDPGQTNGGTVSGDIIITAVGISVSVGDLTSVPISFNISGKPTGDF